jgi:hypothetical protein
VIWFGIGFGIGCASLFASIIRRPIVAKSGFDVIAGFAVSGGLGAIVIGTPLWLIFG